MGRTYRYESDEEVPKLRKKPERRKNRKPKKQVVQEGLERHYYQTVGKKEEAVRETIMADRALSELAEREYQEKLAFATEYFGKNGMHPNCHVCTANEKRCFSDISSIGCEYTGLFLEKDLETGNWSMKKRPTLWDEIKPLAIIK